MNKTINEGELLAYLSGEAQPHVAQALQSSPELQQDLKELAQTDLLFQHLFAEVARPAAQDMVDVVSNQATPTQKLQVAAFLRNSPAARTEMAHLEAAMKVLEPPQKTRRIRLPRFLATPLKMAGVGSRSVGQVDKTQAFYTAELESKVTLHIVPPQREQWQIEGYITQTHQPIANIKVTLRAKNARPRPRYTDEEGFFSFPKLKSGVYRLEAHFEQGILFIPEVRLDDE